MNLLVIVHTLHHVAHGGAEGDNAFYLNALQSITTSMQVSPILLGLGFLDPLAHHVLPLQEDVAIHDVHHDQVVESIRVRVTPHVEELYLGLEDEATSSCLVLD